VRQALLSQADQGKILRVERVTKDEKVFAYEAEVRKGPKRSEIEVGPDGRPLDSGK